MVTHDLMYLKYADIIIQIKDGQLENVAAADKADEIIKKLQSQAAVA